MASAETLVQALTARAATLRGLGYRVRFELTDTDDAILLDAAHGAVEIREAEPDDAAADTTLRLSSDDLTRLIAGRLSPMLAFSTGRLRVEGSKGVALKLASLLDED